MALLSLLVVLIVVGITLYLVNNYIPMDERLKKILNIVVIIFIIIWLLKALGILTYLGTISI